MNSTCFIICFIFFCFMLLLKAIRHCRNLSRPPINKNTSDSTRQIMDAENPAPTPPALRPPAQLPEFENVSSDENYEDPDNLERSRQPSVESIQWPSPYDEIRVRSSSSKPPALPPARPRSTVTAPVTPRPLSMSMSVLEGRVESSGMRESSGHPPSALPLNKRISASDSGSPPSHAMAMPSSDNQLPDLPKKKHSSHVIPPPPPPPISAEERRPSEVKPYVPTPDNNRLYEQPSSPGAPEKGERQYGNLPSPRDEPRSVCDTSVMPSIDESKEQHDSDRPVLPRHDSSTSVVLDSFGYVECIM